VSELAQRADKEPHLTQRSLLLEFAILGLLHDSPMHGYELRRRLNAIFGPLQAISFGSLYPRLRAMQSQGLIEIADTPEARFMPARSRVSYQLTGDGKERFQTLLDDAGPNSWEDDVFPLRFVFFARTDARIRLRVLEGRRARLIERLSGLQGAADRFDGDDDYQRELQRHGVEAADQELKWLDQLITSERARERRLTV
jgi:DNA-binding PadR family transcriptional regulator